MFTTNQNRVALIAGILWQTDTAGTSTGYATINGRLVPTATLIPCKVVHKSQPRRYKGGGMGRGSK